MIEYPHTFNNGTKGKIIIDSAGYKEYWYNDQIHNEDGPAIIYSNGSKYWYYHGKKFMLNLKKSLNDI